MVDLLTMHSSDQATDLVANGHATCGHEHAILEPSADPAISLTQRGRHQGDGK